ncbi:hypothetical protein Y032_0112g309 [Ancylostoma ceylanicum]|uniref:Uncharacterized protein n=1 Tax=Ancylostoma ceylanicum TaxID=53326 RepID=A0A016TE28_9BILA|nr:hypothetical protein Y032_0112g309 [Ancylostoma ceylanicum]
MAGNIVLLAIVFVILGRNHVEGTAIAAATAAAATTAAATTAAATIAAGGGATAAAGGRAATTTATATRKPWPNELLYDKNVLKSNVWTVLEPNCGAHTLSSGLR